MPDVEIHQTNQPPEQPPRDTGPPSSSVWPVLVILLVVVILLVAFVFLRGGRTRPAEATDIEITLPETRAPEVKVPERIEVEVPDKIDVEVKPAPAQPEPPRKQETPPQ